MILLFLRFWKVLRGKEAEKSPKPNDQQLVVLQLTLNLMALYFEASTLKSLKGYNYRCTLIDQQGPYASAEKFYSFECKSSKLKGCHTLATISLTGSFQFSRKSDGQYAGDTCAHTPQPKKLVDRSKIIPNIGS